MALWCSYGVLWWRYWYLPIYHKILLFCIKWHYQVHCSCFLFIKYSVFIYKKKFKAIFCPLKQQLLVKAQPINVFYRSKQSTVPVQKSFCTKFGNNWKCLPSEKYCTSCTLLLNCSSCTYTFEWKIKKKNRKKDSENFFINFIECYVQKMTYFKRSLYNYFKWLY